MPMLKESMKPVMFKSEPELIQRADRIVTAFPEYEGSRSRLIRQAVREHLDRKERELAEGEGEVAA